MTILLALTASALAEPSFTESTCATPTLSDSLPTDGAVGVPIDVQPSLILTGCGSQAMVGLRETGGTVLLEDTWLSGEQLDNAVLITIPLAFDLDPDTAYELVVNGFGAAPTLIGFTTGDTVLAGEGPAPPTIAVELGDATWDGALLIVPATVELTDLVPETIVSVNPGSSEGTVALAPESGTWLLTHTRRIQPGVDLCESAEVTDAAGRVSELARICQPVALPPDEPDDPELDDGRGCDTGRGAAWLGLLVLPFLRRRRS